MGSCWRWLPVNTVWSHTVSSIECCCWWCHFFYGGCITRALTSLLSAGASMMHDAMVVTVMADCVTKSEQSEQMLPNSFVFVTAWLNEVMAWQIVLCNLGRCMSNYCWCRGNVELVRSVLPRVLGGRWAHLFMSKCQFWGRKDCNSLFTSLTPSYTAGTSVPYD